MREVDVSLLDLQVLPPQIVVRKRPLLPSPDSGLIEHESRGQFLTEPIASWSSARHLLTASIEPSPHRFPLPIAVSPWNQQRQKLGSAEYSPLSNRVPSPIQLCCLIDSTGSGHPGHYRIRRIHRAHLPVFPLTVQAAWDGLGNELWDSSRVVVVPCRSGKVVMTR